MITLVCLGGRPGETEEKEKAKKASHTMSLVQLSDHFLSCLINQLQPARAVNLYDAVGLLCHFFCLHILIHSYSSVTARRIVIPHCPIEAAQKIGSILLTPLFLLAHLQSKGKLIFKNGPHRSPALSFEGCLNG